MRRTLVTLVGLLGLAVQAGASTKYQTNLVPTPADCFGGLGVCLNNGASCNDPNNNSDCTASSISPRSSVTLDGKLRVKYSLRGVLNSAGALVTTGPEGASDNYLLDVEVRVCVADVGEIPYCGSSNIPTTHLYIEVPLSSGIAKGKIDLRPVLTGPSVNLSTGTSLVVSRVSLLTPHPVCSGTNSATDIAARINQGCNDGVGVLAVPGVVIE